MKLDKMIHDYALYTQIKEQFDSAKKSGDQIGQEAAKRRMDDFEENIEQEGETYARIFSWYLDSRKKGNELIDLNDPYQYKEEDKLITTLREYGVKQFTFSSTWSSATESAWKFIQAGAKLDGMVEIVAGFDTWSGTPEMKPAYLFVIQ